MPTKEEIRDNLSALATNVTMHAIALHERPVMTLHDAKTRDTIYELLMALQPTKPTEMGGDTAPLAAKPQSSKDERLDGVFSKFKSLDKVPAVAG